MVEKRVARERKSGEYGTWQPGKKEFRGRGSQQSQMLLRNDGDSARVGVVKPEKWSCRGLKPRLSTVPSAVHHMHASFPVYLSLSSVSHSDIGLVHPVIPKAQHKARI